MRIACMVLMTAALAGSLPVAAQNYPSRVIRIVVPFTPGGPQDVNARLIGQKLTEAWGQPVVVENRAAAGGIVATEYVSKAAPDGYTLLMGNPTPLTIAPSLYDKLGYDPQRQFAPVILVTQTASVFVVHPSVPAKNIKELVALAKTKPGRLIYGTSGIGSTGHLTIELFNTLTGVSMTHVPYKGATPMMTDLVTGRVTFTIDTAASAMSQIRAGTVKALAVTTAKRSPVLPDVPTVAESGLPGFVTTTWYSVDAPKGLPVAVRDRIYQAMLLMLKNPEMQKTLEGMAAQPGGMPPEAFAKFVTEESKRWNSLADDFAATKQ